MKRKKISGQNRVGLIILGIAAGIGIVIGIFASINQPKQETKSELGLPSATPPSLQFDPGDFAN